MHDRLGVIEKGHELSARAARDLLDVGFAVIQGPVEPRGLARLAAAYDSAVDSAGPCDVSVGGTTTRVHDLVNRGPEFDALYVYGPVLDACRRVIGRPFRLSTLLARTLRPGARAQPLHVDYGRDDEGWPMVGFILMVDEFRRDNGATRFVPGSHRSSAPPDGLLTEAAADYDGQLLACGTAGSVIVYNGAVWHGHSANSSGEPRRSIQGAYIRRDARPGCDWPSRMRPETLARIGPLARYLLAV
ncbi:MAG TPA: phytanoyl-CoA dioxygenase family protein [Pyrinomonadaceae bacterium]|jgi:ectoine hydroxylase-related dioxygenase (phytanoyl-CoA dioxygenase family)